MKANIIYDPRYKAIISRLVQARKSAGLTQEELARKLGLQQPELSRIEKLDRQIDLIEFLDWIKATGIAEFAVIAKALEAAND